MPAEPLVVHLLTAETPAARLEMLAVLLGAQGVAAAQKVVQLGSGPLRRQPGFPVERLHATAGVAGLGDLALQRFLDQFGREHAGAPRVLHAWSSSAAGWCGPLLSREQTALVEVDPEVDAGWLANVAPPSFVAYVTQTVLGGRKLLAGGVPADRCVLIRLGVNRPAYDGENRGQARRRLGLRDDDVVITPLPPIERRTGAFIVTWGSFLLQKVVSRVRVVVPAEGADVERVRHLAEACRHEWMVRYAPRGMGLPDLLAATDLAAYLVSGPAPMDGLAWAMSTGCPVVGGDVPAVREFLEHGRSAWLCPPDRPAAVAESLLRAIEQADQSRIQAGRAMDVAARMFSLTRAVDRYRRAYADLAAQRPLCSLAGEDAVCV